MIAKLLPLLTFVIGFAFREIYDAWQVVGIQLLIPEGVIMALKYADNFVENNFAAGLFIAIILLLSGVALLAYFMHRHEQDEARQREDELTGTITTTWRVIEDAKRK